MIRSVVYVIVTWTLQFSFQVMILLVDGPQARDQGSNTPLEPFSRPLKDRGVQIYTVGVRPRSNQEELTDIASSDRNVFWITEDNFRRYAPRVTSGIYEYARNKRWPQGTG